MKLVDRKINLLELRVMVGKSLFGLVKAVVDVEKELMVVEAELHADEEQFLLERGSKQESLWGINLYPDKYGSDDFIEYDSMINLRPSWGNMSRGVDDESVRSLIKKIVLRLVKNEES